MQSKNGASRGWPYSLCVILGLVAEGRSLEAMPTRVVSQCSAHFVRAMSNVTVEIGGSYAQYQLNPDIPLSGTLYEAFQN